MSKIKKPSKTFGVADLAKSMGLKEGTVRLKLRGAKVKRTGRGYAWKSMPEVTAMAKKLSA